MNYDEFDVERTLKKELKFSPALNLIKGLEYRRAGYNEKAKEDIELFAEQEFVRKPNYSEMKCELPGLPRSSFLMVFSSDGTKIASTHGNHNIYVTDSRSGKNIKTLVGHPRTPWCIAFHPTSNQIVASGCLGGQVRIWDLSGGSECWTTENQSVIASIAFHPNDRVLVIATYNEVYFWDWSKPTPFVQCSTNNPKEKVRFVAFDSLGHKLITGIANSPQTRWERVRAPVPVNSRICCTFPYRRRITPRLLNIPPQQQPNVNNESPTSQRERETYSGIPDRERRITTCYRNLVREYEQLVQRYLQLYRPREMIDRGTDPMETSPTSTTSGTQTPEPSTSNVRQTSTTTTATSSPSSEPSTSRSRCECQPERSPSISMDLLHPSRIFTVFKSPPGLIRGTQTTESRKHKVDREVGEGVQEKKIKKQNPGDTPSSSSESPDATPNTQLSDMGTQTQSPRRLLVLNTSTMRTPEPSTSFNQPSTSRMSLRNAAEARRNSNMTSGPSSSTNLTDSDTLANNVDELLSNIRRTAEEEVRSRILPIIRSVPANDRPELIRLFENNREHYRMRIRQMCSNINKKPRRWSRNYHLTNTSSENNSSSDDESASNRPARHTPTSAQPSSSSTPNPTQESPSTSSTSRNPATKNYNTELEQLVTSLLTEFENRETDNSNTRQTSDNRTRTATTASTTQTSSDSLLNRPSSSRVAFSNTSTTTNTSSRYSPTSSLERSLFSSALPPGPPARSSSSTSNTENNSSSTSPQNFEFLSLFESLDSYRDPVDPATTTPCTTSSTSDSTNVQTTIASTMTTNTKTTNSAVYTSNSFRRFMSNRASAFMPTRVHYTRTPSRLRRCRNFMNRGANLRGSFGLDELTNYSERANSEDDPPSSALPNPQPNVSSDPLSAENIFDTPPYPRSPENFGIGNLVHDLESSLNDMQNIRDNSRPGDGSDMLSNFSERLENIWNQSDTILRNIRNSLQLNGGTPEREPSWSFYDPNFYVRDQRNDPTLDGTDLPNVGDNLNSRMFNAVASDHTYPRNPDRPQQSSRVNDQLSSPLMNSLHITITHIQRQTRLLRQQVEGIERVDRAMLEVEQILLLRQLVIELIKHMRITNSEGRNTGMSSVRQMMAGTRISDSSPYDSPAEDSSTPSSSQATTPTAGPSTSTIIPPRPEVPIPNPNPTPEGTSPPHSARTRGSSRKTYPSCRLLRLQRNSPRPSLGYFVSRRYMNRGDRGSRQNPQPRTTARMADILSPYRQQTFSSCATINSSTLSLMTRRLDLLLTEQMRFFTRPSETPPPSRSSGPSIDLGEHILSLRLHGCVLRMNRLLASQANPRPSLQSDPSATVSQDGVSRYGARHTLSLIVDGMTRHIEELGNSSSSQTLRLEIHGLLAMSLLLTELLLLQVVDSIPPPPSTANLDPERDFLASRIRGYEEMCTQIEMNNRFNNSPHPLARSLRLMRLTMKHAYRALGQTYTARRNAMLPRQQTDRRQLIGSISRCLRTINRVSNLRRNNNSQENNTEGNTRDSGNSSRDSSNRNSNGSNDSNSANLMNEWYSTITDYIGRSSNSEATNSNNPSTNRTRNYFNRTENTSSNNSDDNDEEIDWLDGVRNNPASPAPNLYRPPVIVSTSEPSSSRAWNVPSVQVNDVPVTDPSTINQILISQRQRFAERVSELRQNSSMGLFRPRFLHPLHASVNPFDADLDDPQREPVYESDMVTTATPNHRLQAWDISDWTVPSISNPMKNVIVSECKIHNDASVDLASDGTLLVTLLPSGGYLNVTNRLGVYSLRWETLGQCLYTTSFEQNAISVSLSPLSRHLLVGLTSRRVSIVSNDRWVMARIFKIEQKDVPGDRLPMVRELEQTRDSRINCIRWLPCSGQGIIYGTNTGQLIVLT